MNSEQLKERGFEREFIFTTSRSSGPGGQNVNKVNSKVELRFSIHQSIVLSDFEKHRLLNRISHNLISTGELVFVSQTYRSQQRNKEDAIERFFFYLAQTLTRKKRRKPTKPTRASVEKRLNKKRNLSQIKQKRKRPEL